METIDNIIDRLALDNECNSYLADWIINRIFDIQSMGNLFEVISIKGGYIINEYNNSSFLCVSYLYKNFI